MYKVEKTADTLFRGVDNMMNGAKEDYIKWSNGWQRVIRLFKRTS